MMTGHIYLIKEICSWPACLFANLHVRVHVRHWIYLGKTKAMHTSFDRASQPIYIYAVLNSEGHSATELGMFLYKCVHAIKSYFVRDHSRFQPHLLLNDCPIVFDVHILFVPIFSFV